MMIVFEILIYVFFAWIMYSLAKESNKKYPNSMKMDSYLWGYVFFYTFICAIRWKVGMDSISYAKSFIYGRRIHGDNNESEWLFSEFVNFISTNGIHYSIGMAICAFLQIYPITKSLLIFKSVLKYVPIVLFGSMYFLDLNNGVRQMIVACWFLYASKWIVDKCWWKYFLFVFIAHYIHSSSLILAPLYFLVHIPNLEKIPLFNKVCTSIFLVSLIIGLNPSYQNLVGQFDGIMETLGYDGYTERLTETLLRENTNKQAFGLQKMSYFLSFCSFIYLGKELYFKYGKSNALFSLWWFLGFIYGCLYFLVGGMSYLFQRPLMYFELFSMIMIAFVFHFLHYSKSIHFYVNRNLLKKILVFVMWSSICWNLYKSLNQPDPQMEYTAYKTILFHDIN